MCSVKIQEIMVSGQISYHLWKFVKKYENKKTIRLLEWELLT